MLDEVEEGENENPNKVNEVPVQAYFLDHFIVLSALHNTVEYHEENHDVDDDTGEDVEAVKASNEEEEIAVALLYRVLTVVKVSTKSEVA